MAVGHEDQTQDAPNNSGRNWRGIRFRRRLNEEDRTEATAIEPTSDGNGRPAEAPAGTFDPSELASEGVAEQLRLTCDTSEEPVLFEVDAILEWPTPARVNFFRFVAYLDQRYRIRAEGSDEEFPDAFEFVITQLENATDVGRCQAGCQAALEAAAVLHPAALVPACNRIVGRLRGLRVRGVRMEDLLREARAMVESLQTDADVEELIRVQDELPGVPASANLVVPPGWSLSSGGLSCGYGTILLVPVVLTARLVGEDGTEFLGITFQCNGRWEGREIPREKIATARGVLSLARMGLPVHSLNARQLVEYFAVFETANRDFLPARRVVDRMGWHHIDGTDVFAVGETVIAPERSTDASTPALDGEDLAPAEPMVFRPRTAGDSDLASGGA